MDITALPGVFRVWEPDELTQSVSPGNPTTRSFNISEIAGNASQVWIRFQFTGIWGYAWYIDDVQIRQQFEYDAELTSARVELPNTGIEYGRIPVSQIPDYLTLNCEIKNAGSLPLNNLTLQASIIETNSNSVLFNENVAYYPTLAAGANIGVIENIVLDSSPEGNYEVYFNLLSSEQTCDGNLTNNSITKYLQYTSDQYAIDSDGLYPPDDEISASIGTNSFTDNSDEFMAMSFYPIIQTATVYGVEVLITDNTIEGSQIIISIHDSLDIFSDIVSNPLIASDVYTVNANDISNGFAYVPFVSPFTIGAGGYYTAATLFSSGNTFDIRIRDILTISQPTMASMIYLPSDGMVYSNGNAFGIRMIFGNNTQIAGCTNPSACNYNPSAITNDGSCLFIGSLCNDGNPSTTNDVVQSNCGCFGTLTSTDCNPSDFSFGGAAFGIYPETNTSLIDGCINQPYFQPFYILIPTDAGSIDQAYAGVPISNMILDGLTIDGNPISDYGLTYTCSNSSCMFPAGSQYCFNVYGTPNLAGVFDVTINFTLNANLAGFPIEIPYAITPYILNIAGNCSATVPGCTNPSACNFNPDATVENNSCIIPGTACNDNNSATVNDVIQSNCQCAGNPIDPGCSGFTVSNNTSNPTCPGVANGSIAVTASGNSGPFSYLWSNGSSSASINNLTPGTYSVSITDNGGCIESISFNLIAPTNISAVTSTSPVQCYGASTGSASVAVSGGTPPYSYMWNTSPIQTTSSINNVPAANYSVTITDNNGCTSVWNANITQPTNQLLVEATATTASCSQNDGSAIAVVSGASGNIQYLWSNGQITAQATNLAAGIYTISVTAGGCTATNSVSVNNTNAPSITLLSSSPACFGSSTGTVNAVVSGGSTPYQFIWSNGSNSASQSGLSAGNYTLIVLDNAGCQALETVSLSQPDPISIGLTTSSTACTGSPQGSITAVVSGGTSPYQYQWSTGSTASSISGLTAGNYTLTINDAAGCSQQSSTTVSNPNGVEAFATVTNVTCTGGNDGTAAVTITSGAAPFNYEWSTGATGSSILYNLTAGDYECTITDANGCTFTVSTSITEPQGNLPEILGLSTVDPFTLQTYSIAEIDGATLTWIVDGGNILNGQGNNFIQVQWSDAPIASITLLITYANGCEASINLTIQIGNNVTEVSNPAFISLFPNPVSKQLQIELSQTNEKMPFVIYDARGKIVLQETLNVGTNLFNCENLSSGIYTLRIAEGTDKIYFKRFMKE
jgi:hypothetical protein